MDQWQDFPVIPGGHSVTAAGATRLLEDGAIENGQQVQVFCDWLGNGPPFTVNGLIYVGSGSAERHIEISSPMVVGQAMVGSALVSGPDLPQPYAVGMPDLCMFTATDVDAASHRVRGHFVCGTLEGTTSGERCKAGESYFTFENCKP